MELRHIRYFLAIAAEGNFTRAAQRLGIAQPPLSQQIRDLEAEIGTALFRRVPHGAELTEAGRAFRDRVQALPDAAAGAAAAARLAAEGRTGLLRLGITGTAALNPLVPQLIREFRTERPGIALMLTESNSVRLREDVLEGRLDAAILRPSRSDPPGLECLTFASERLVLARSGASDPFPREPAARLQDMAEEPLILTPREVGISLHDAAILACREAGFEPRMGQLAPQIVTVLSLISAGLGFSLMPAAMRRLRLEGVVYKELAGPSPQVSIALATRRPAPHAARALPVQAFMAKVQALS
ncbi:LysR family transcriptional regulator [Pseudogemmobacter bohemicus]|uniref:LysR family transcriptional regulator n=1 Tax=Pseudogemmobacter bohemicus TaxID=2250708 RepID=UPI000DD3E2A3|nr:LysR family transcriptional regulator [Pseudogemmobacter bohemicus]